MENPEVKIYGKGDGAKYLSSIDLNIASSTYGQVLSADPETSELNSQGINYDYADTTIAFEGGFSKMNASGKVATAEFGDTSTQNQAGGQATRYNYSIRLTDGGSGYNDEPTLIFVGAPPGMEGQAVIDPVSGRVTSVSITNQGQNTVLYQNPRVFLSGGLTYPRFLSRPLRKTATVMLYY